VLRYLSGHFSDRATANSQAEVRFNYLGQLDQVLSESALFEVDRTPGTSRSPRGNRRYLLDISGFVLGVSSTGVDVQRADASTNQH